LILEVHTLIITASAKELQLQNPSNIKFWVEISVDNHVFTSDMSEHGNFNALLRNKFNLSGYEDSEVVEFRVKNTE
jgi:hypothetical protein